MLFIGHRRMRRAVERFVDGELDPVDRLAVAAHVRRCPKCGPAALVLVRMKEALRRRRAPTVLATARLRGFALQNSDHPTGTPWPTST